MKKPKVLIGLPTMGSVHPLTMMVILSWMAESFNGGEYSLSIYPTVNVQPVDNARNQIVGNFLKSDCTHLFFIDSDTVPPIDALKRLLAHKMPIISAMTPIVEQSHTGQYWRNWNCVSEQDEKMKPNTGVLKAKGVGSSCVLIERGVFEKMAMPYYRFQYHDDDGKDIFVSEDIFFIIKAASLGIETYADTSILCQHSKLCMF